MASFPSGAPAHTAPPASKPNLRERFNAMRNMPPFLKQIWQTSPWLTISSLGLRLIRAVLPIITLYIGKLIIDEAVRLVALGLPFEALGEAWRGGQLDHLLSLL